MSGHEDGRGLSDFLDLSRNMLIKERIVEGGLRLVDEDYALLSGLGKPAKKDTLCALATGWLRSTLVPNFNLDIK